MKIFLPLIFFILSSAYGATCTNTTRTNYGSNTVLTSSALNADFNQLVTKANAMDGGCVSDGTLESTAFDSSLDALKNGIHQGCTLSYSDANTVSVGKCILSVNGKFVKTTVAKTATWGCPSCSAEVVSTQYYVYALTTSGGSTLNLLISTVAPGTDGLDGSGNKVIGKFYNNSSGAIEQYSIFPWVIRDFVQQDTLKLYRKDSFTFGYGASLGNICTGGIACAYLSQLETFVTSITNSSAGQYTILFPRTYHEVRCWGNANLPLANGLIGYTFGTNTNSITLNTINLSGVLSDTYGTVHCEGY